MSLNLMKRFFNRLSLALLCIAFNLYGESASYHYSLIPVSPPFEAPPLKLKAMHDELVDLATLRGQVVVVNFWATWCRPCRREMPSLERLYQTVGDKGVKVLAVDVGEDPETVSPFLESMDPRPGFPILFDTDSTAVTAWRIKGMPSTFVVDPEGRIVYMAVGAREFDHPKLVQRLLELKASATAQ
jgi:thiol-disulfide isomerase/thioredoxin